MRASRPHRGALSVAAALALLSGCTAPAARPAPTAPAGGLRLVAFDSCADTLAGLRAAARRSVTAWGLPGSGPEYGFRAGLDDRGGNRAAVAAGAPGVPAGPAGHSSTNNHEIGVDEPDIVKTDGRRIVTITAGVLRNVDPRTRRITGELKLATSRDGERSRWGQTTLLLHGDHALVLVAPGPWPAWPTGIVDRDPRVPDVGRSRVLLVDLAGTPKLLGEYRIDGTVVDARQVAGTARIVVRSAPRLLFPRTGTGTEAERLAANRKVVDTAPLAQWLPRYEIVTNGRTRGGQVGCDRISHPPTYSGTSMITVVSLDLGRSELAGDDPLTVVADGDTVYSNGKHLYVVHDQRWRIASTAAAGSAPDQVSEIYQFDITGPGVPRYVTAATVPGWLINQYALSEWDGHLRVATTAGTDAAKQRSAVHVLRADGRTLRETGRVDGLGRGERIYAVRFTGDKGYVVTFRQTDPLYTVDLRDPAAPRVAGELKITGYSSYLHPVDGGRLVGVGQEASDQGRIEGTQVSLFDVTDLAHPTRLARHHVRLTASRAEHDPHAFLYWPARRLLVVPIARLTDVDEGALALRVTENGFAALALLTHPGTARATASIRRSLVVADTLWTLSDAGLMATDLSTMDKIGWVPLT